MTYRADAHLPKSLVDHLLEVFPIPGAYLQKSNRASLPQLLLASLRYQRLSSSAKEHLLPLSGHMVALRK